MFLCEFRRGWGGGGGPQNMQAAPSLIFYAFELFPIYSNQHNYAIPQVIHSLFVCLFL